MKKIAIVLFTITTLILSSVINITEADAATSSSAVLTTNQTSSSTSRISVTNYMDITIWNYGVKTIKYTIFKSGVAYSSGTVAASDRYINSKLSLPNGDYSVRLYCGVYSRTTGCAANVNISDN